MVMLDDYNSSDDEGPAPQLGSNNVDGDDASLSSVDGPPLMGRPQSSSDSESSFDDHEEDASSDFGGFRNNENTPDESVDGEALPPIDPVVELVGLMVASLRDGVGDGTAQAETTNSNRNGDDVATSSSNSAVGKSTSAFTQNLSPASPVSLNPNSGNGAHTINGQEHQSKNNKATAGKGVIKHF